MILQGRVVGDPPKVTIIFQPDETGSLTFSQLNLAHHTIG
jgi:hypothetical protein